MPTDLLQQIWQEPNLRSGIISLAIAFVGDAIRRLILPKASIVWGISHQHFFIIPSGTTSINLRTRQLIVQNVGRASAEDVEITFNYKPEHFDVWPPGIVSADNRDRFMIMTVKNLNRREFFVINIVSQYLEIPEIVGARWKGGNAKQRLMGPMQIYPRWAQLLAGGLCFIGALSVLFVLVRGILALPR